ncbi:hypothetical protein [Methylobacterium sp. E-045]|uniref:hypothetical protein n=1 Tax=Methylobacterium sp. E-045 TaxID=2836575 RepID=UPI001FB998F2|nr:hypothetical protein [Methylobacterium sp. E-045]MCJ2127995.1 hypothetical protein [Methylobacterium sp. E-045]
MARRKTIADAEAAEAARFLEGATEIGPLDPVNRAIATHRAAQAELIALVHNTVPAKRTSGLKAQAEELDQARRVFDAATTAFVRTPIETMAQLVTFTGYVASLERDVRSWFCPYEIKVWHLGEAMDAVADALTHLSAAPPAVPITREAIALAA